MKERDLQRSAALMLQLVTFSLFLFVAFYVPFRAVTVIIFNFSSFLFEKIE